MSRVISGLRQAKILRIRWIVMGLQHKRSIGLSVSLMADIRHINRTHRVVSNPNPHSPI